MKKKDKTNKHDKKFQNEKKDYFKKRIQSGLISKLKNSKFNVEESDNDFSWYNQSPQLVKDVANIPYSDFLGLPVNLGANDTTSNAFPGICKLKLYPTLGNCGMKGDAPNIAAQTLYAFIRSYNSGSRNYYAADYFMYLYSVASLYGVYAELVRTYGLCRKYSLKNRYVGKMLVQAMGYDYDDLVANLSDFRAIINNFALELNSFAIPAKFNYIDRLTWIPLHIYKDSDIDKAQLYAMQYTHTYKWNPTAIKTGSALEPVLCPWAHGTGSTSLNDIREFIASLLGAIRLNEDVAIMSGDTYKAFGANGIRSIVMIPEDVITEPIYNEGVLSQIHNARICGTINSYDPRALKENFGLDVDAGIEASEMLGKGWIYQDNEVIYSEPFVNINNLVNGNEVLVDSITNMKVILDCPYEESSPEFNMEASRLISHPYGRMLQQNTLGSSIIKSLEVGCCGTEIVESVNIYFYSHSDQMLDYFNIKFMSDFENINDATEISMLTKFDWAPYKYGAYWDSDMQAWYNVKVIGDTFNYAVIPLKSIQGMHEVAILSLFNLVSLLQETRTK